MAEPSPSPNGDATGVKQVAENFFKISLTEQNKANLFADALDRLACTREEAEITLHNLQAWAPDVAKSFSQRTSSTILQTPFRVICSKQPVENPVRTATESTLQGTHPFDASFIIRQYLAISYSWHNSQWPATPHSAPVPGSIWPIGKRFAEAIVSERGHVREGIWMDQICIDQENNSEKQLAIACMDVVYRTCRKLVVLLEDVELTEDEADLCRKYEAFAYKLDHEPQDTTEAVLLISLHDKVAAARWWQRSWCFHEFVVGEPWSDKRHQTVHNTVFVIGLGEANTLRVEWSTLHSILATVTLQLGHRNQHSQHLNPILAGFSNRTSPLMESRHPRAGALVSSFMARFNAVCQTACTMPGDRLSVCINLIGIGLAYFRRHEPTEDEVYHLAVLLSLAAGEKVVLSFVNSEPLKVSGKLSWMNRSIAAADTTLDKFALGNIKGIHNISAERLELDMIFFTGTFTGCSEDEINATHRIFPGAIKSTMPPLKTEAMRMPAFRTDEEMEMPRRQFLASILAGGTGLAKRIWSQLQDEVIRWKYNTGIFADFTINDDLRIPSEEFQRALHERRGDQEEGCSIEAALGLITWITDPRSIYWMSAPIARIKSTMEGDIAILSQFLLTYNFSAVSSDSQMQVAVPTDLLDGDCGWTRAWILMPSVSGNENNEWKVVAKTLLLGETNLGEEARRETAEGTILAVSARPRQIVLG
ncbi:hypothetical protein CcaCcLH18_04351 [Colletotrichum camelliae]|nr:hypothetical protein CcaCcLH18_04351 [Colletotrichum camelliae]